MILIGATGAAVSYGTTRVAVEKGSVQAATGSVLAALTSTVSITTVGAAMFAATYAGFTREPVDQLRLETFASLFADYVHERQEAGGDTLQVVTAVRKVEASMAATAECELRSGCINKSGVGGSGPAHRATLLQANEASAILAQVEAGNKRVQPLLALLSDQQRKFHEILVDPEKSLKIRRAALRDSVAEIDHTLSALDQAIPLKVLDAYSNELLAGTLIVDRPEASAKLSEIMADNGRALGSVLSATRIEAVRTKPEFPVKTGVSEAFRWLGHFLPLAMIVFIVEMVFPLCIWIYTFISLKGRVQIDDPLPPQSDPDPDSFEGRLQASPVPKNREGKAHPGRNSNKRHKG